MSPTPDVVELAAALIGRRSVTPEDAGCQPLVGKRLTALGFEVEAMPFGGVSNLWARRGHARPLVVFVGHTDVVPAGDEAAWTSPPFEGTVADGVLRGRGAADMKGAVAAFLAAVERFVGAHPAHGGSIGVLLTSDEEGPAKEGIVQVVPVLTERGIHVDHALVGEPSSQETLGDVIRVGRRGSLRGELVVHGTAGHTAYPERADNAIHRFAPALADLCTTAFPGGDAHFPPTSFQMSRVEAFDGATNVIPGRLRATFNLRYGTGTTKEELAGLVGEVLDRHGLRYDLAWHEAGRPFLSEAGALVRAVERAVEAETGAAPRRDSGGGTSDGRFLAPMGSEIVELGLLAQTIHQVDEQVPLADLDALARIYEGVLDGLLGSGNGGQAS